MVLAVPQVLDGLVVVRAVVRVVPRAPDVRVRA
jgi:hypothetical protein